MAEHADVYQNEAERYHVLVSHEDFHQNLAAAIHNIIPPGGIILETGSGTGRVTNNLLPIARELVSFDLSLPMLAEAKRVSNFSQPEFFGYGLADHRSLPVNGNRFDWVVSGWSVCYLVSWQNDQWKQHVTRALKEFIRVLNSDGQILIIETLGTGKSSPEPPPPLVEYLNFLEEVGFQRQWIRTDYQFPDLQIANDLTGFFFGPEMLAQIGRQTHPILPECTGLWVCRKSEIMNNLPD
jgi:ubiquinone/menaquinone biosynthesis C-methylase UbiE